MMGDTVTYGLVLWTPDRAVQARALAGVTVSLDKSLYPHSASPNPSSQMSTGEFNAGRGGERVILFWTSIVSEESRMLHKPGYPPAVGTIWSDAVTLLYTLVTSRSSQALQVSLGGARTWRRQSN